MPKEPSHHLFQLIKSLGKSEKAFFPKYMSLLGKKAGNSLAVTLFNLIDMQKQYDEKTILQQLKNVKPGHLAFLKNHLYKQVLKSLDFYHSEEDAETEIKNLLQHIKILFDKELYAQCIKCISKAKFLAEANDKFPELFQIHDWEVKLVFRGRHILPEENTLENIWKKYKNVKEYEQLNLNLGLKIQKEGPDRLNVDYKNHSLLDDEKKALSARALYLLYSYHARLGFAQGEFEKAYHYSIKTLGLMESRPDYFNIPENPSNYIRAFNYFISCQTMLGKFDEIPASIEKLKKVNVKSSAMKKGLLYDCLFKELSLYINTGLFYKAVNKVEEIEKETNKKRHKGEEFIFYYLSAHAHFGNENYSKARGYLNKIIHNPSITWRVDLQCFSRIYSLIVHYELGNQDLLEYTIISTYRYLLKRKRLYKFEDAILLFIRKNLSEVTNKKTLIETLKKFQKTLQEIFKDPYEATVLQYLDFSSWIESKIENRPFAEVVKEKAIGKSKES